MSAKVMELHRVIDRLDERQLDALYKVAICFVTQNDFDYISPEESEAINRSFDEIRRGDCVHFESAEEMAAHFGVSI
jgi:hypothetical protein